MQNAAADFAQRQAEQRDDAVHGAIREHQQEDREPKSPMLVEEIEQGHRVARYESYFAARVAEFLADVAKNGLARAPRRISVMPFELARLRLSALWDALIPKCALNVEIGATHTTYLHPRKGRRRVSNARLGLSPVFR